MSTYSSLLFIGVLPVTQGVLFTVPTAFTCVVRDIELSNGTGAIAGPVVSAVVSGSQAAIYIASNLASFAHVQWQGRVVIPAGGQIVGVDSHGGQQAIISGYLLAD